MTIIVVADRESTQPQWTEALRTNPNPAAESGKYLIRYLKIGTCYLKRSRLCLNISN